MRDPLQFSTKEFRARDLLAIRKADKVSTAAQSCARNVDDEIVCRFHPRPGVEELGAQHARGFASGVRFAQADELQVVAGFDDMDECVDFLPFAHRIRARRADEHRPADEEGECDDGTETAEQGSHPWTFTYMMRMFMRRNHSAQPENGV